LQILTQLLKFAFLILDIALCPEQARE